MVQTVNSDDIDSAINSSKRKFVLKSGRRLIPLVDEYKKVMVEF